MKFHFDELFQKAQRLAKKHGGTVTLRLPFISLAVNPDDVEKKVARELMVRLLDRRVLSSKECCDNCIDNSLASIQEIRKVLVDKQVELSLIQVAKVAEMQTPKVEAYLRSNEEWHQVAYVQPPGKLEHRA
jgi:hypothetical protein